MTGRFTPAAALTIATLAAIGYLLVAGDAPFVVLLVAAVGAPLAVLALARALADPEGTSRLMPSLLIGATVVPVLVVALHAAFWAAGFGLIAPLAEGLRELADALRSDPELIAILSSPWAYVLLVEMAVVAPLAEETLKPLGALMRRPGSARDAFLYGAAAGAGFAAVENVLYASGWLFSFHEWLPISVLRMTGAALHPLGAGLVALGFYRLQSGGAGQLLRRYGAAFGAHALWNGSVAVAIVLFADGAATGLPLGGTALAWGTALTIYLGVLGGLLLAALVAVARSLGRGDDDPRLLPLGDLARPAPVGAWALASSLLMVPVAILVLLFPGFIAL